MYAAANGARRDNKKVHRVMVVIFDDVKPTAADIKAAQELRKLGVVLFAFGVAQSVSEKVRFSLITSNSGALRLSKSSMITAQGLIPSWSLLVTFHSNIIG